ncbi:biotin--[acetyl-CoA-carboxylase] ligase [Methylobacterium iners]|uniref:biotin--[biotin carboxyl-carrier protein] ligase n=1 Tax=Methylobacterium iners TaxID=418707 RepID=A0ABQ4RXZ6_9HYPH|nr:biotin--[acetyl-CoA-carboxylase] ligase [Methylobacterium iners]GJD95062.1 Bifunctional ligase/repressor BirA [Methylobacterium iners]
MAYRLGAASLAAGHRLAVFESLGSTNTEALERAHAGEAGPVWIVTRRQEAGRGRRGNAWASPPGNLAASLLLSVDEVDPTQIATLGFVAGVALVDAIHQAVAVDIPLSPLAGRGLPAPCRAGSERSEGEGASPEVAPPETPPHLRLPPRRADDEVVAALSPPGGERGCAQPSLKWPNDVLIDGAKLAGILLEAENIAEGRRCVVIGIGVNVAAVPEGLPYPATCLRQSGHGASAESVFELLSDRLAETITLWDRGRGFAAIRALWLARAAGLGAPLSVRTGRESVQGIFETIDEAGRLVVRSDDGMRRTVTAGEVHFGTAATAA